MDLQEPHSMISDSMDSNNSYFTQYSSSDSLRSSIFGFSCKICYVRCVTNLDLESQFLQNEVFLIDLDKEIWIKCDECGSVCFDNAWCDVWCVEW